MGRIAILWGQIEHFVDELLPAVSGLTPDELEALQLSDKPMQAKVAFLKATAKRHSDKATAEETLQFCALIDETKVNRNHVFHGIWGWRGDDRSKSVFPAARKSSDLHSPFAAQKLPALEKKLCKCSRLGFDLVVRVSYGQSGRPHPSRFLHHGVQGDAPEWLHQWSERNPWDGDARDRIEKAGQLPRRLKLYPEK